MAKITEQSIKDLKTLSDQIKYLEEEFNGKLYGSCPDGDVKLYQMLQFAKDYDWLLTEIIGVSRKL